MASIEKRAQGSEVTYRVKVRRKGTPTQSATFKRLTDAKKWANNIESAIQEGRHFKSNESKKHTFADLADRYIKNILPLKPKSTRDQTRQMNWWKKELGEYLIVDITTALIVEKRDVLLSGITPKGNKRTPSTANRYLAVLSHAYTVATKEWEWATENPVKNISKLSEPKGVVRFLSDDERKRLLLECKESRTDALYPIVLLALSTGVRHGEILNLLWDDINFERNAIILTDTKNGDTRQVPLVGLTKETFQQWFENRNTNSALVFPSKADNTAPLNVRTAWEEALTRANIENFRFHDLRHSAASYLAMNGASLAEIAEVLGHKTLAMVKRYAHLSDAHTASVVERMNAKIFGE
jgi:integrase